MANNHLFIAFVIYNVDGVMIICWILTWVQVRRDTIALLSLQSGINKKEKELIALGGSSNAFGKYRYIINLSFKLLLLLLTYDTACLLIRLQI